MLVQIMSYTNVQLKHPLPNQFSIQLRSIIHLYLQYKYTAVTSIASITYDLFFFSSFIQLATSMPRRGATIPNHSGGVWNRLIRIYISEPVGFFLLYLLISSYCTASSPTEIIFNQYVLGLSQNIITCLILAYCFFFVASYYQFWASVCK